MKWSSLGVGPVTAREYLNKAISCQALSEWVTRGFSTEEAVSWILKKVPVSEASSQKRKDTNQQEGYSYRAACSGLGPQKEWKGSLHFEEYVQEKNE
ncbi:hypothetical protein DSO57_1023196 [Entomophthora muscae]|uniref:Uncharacterized protein n=1 Tax=Entomophthora muscae TaxID=34485 RepID=A0ACC2U0T2_9FUNG|nr:hypothetical protein DSO57_1023196 [Entomophthora muscae]